MYPSESRLILEMTELNVEPRLGYNIIRALYSKFSENSIEHIKMKLIHCFLKWIVLMDSTTNLHYLATSFHVCGVG